MAMLHNLYVSFRTEQRFKVHQVAIPTQFLLQHNGLFELGPDSLNIQPFHRRVEGLADASCGYRGSLLRCSSYEGVTFLLCIEDVGLYSGHDVTWRFFSSRVWTCSSLFYVLFSNFLSRIWVKGSSDPSWLPTWINVEAEWRLTDPNLTRELCLWKSCCNSGQMGRKGKYRWWKC